MAEMRNPECALSASANLLSRSTEKEMDGTMPSQYFSRASQLTSWIWITTLCIFTALIPSTQATFINFDNCLTPSILNSQNPQQLQFVPQFVDARFDLQDPRHILNLTVYGNVTGQAVYGTYPPPSDPSWNDPSNPFGKIVDSSVNYTTLFTTYNVLTYTPYTAPPSRFCNSTVKGDCPWGPLFFANASVPQQLHAFQVSHEFDSTYAFTTIIPTITIKSGDAASQFLACISAPLAPYLGDSLGAALRYLPLVILIFVGAATVIAARLSPWSSSDFFYWSSNYGRDEDVLRLVTPGFGDCLQYIQFIVLAGSLTLEYPGYYQPVVSRASWSTLMFNESFVSQGNGYQAVQDGIYALNGTYGLTRMSQLAGMTSNTDVWAGMAVWLCVIIGALVVLCQIGFASSWIQKKLSKTSQEDLRSKNLPFTGGNIVRVVFNYFLLPIIAFTMYQLVLAGSSPTAVTAMAVVGLVLLFLFAAWIFFFIFKTKPRVHLFDHLPLLLFYGPLYNTYSDEAAPFAFIPALLTLFRGIAIGAVQPSGIAQLVILAICEVIFILTLHAFRPFQSISSMNAYHTFFSVVRLVTLFLSISFVPSLSVAEGTKGWVGYVILLLHAIVLVFGFFMNAIQTLIEVFARRAGAGNSNARGGLKSVFGVRQLSKRVKKDPEHRISHRASLGSDAAILARDADMKSLSQASRARSLSASSRMMLDEGRMGNRKRASSTFDQMSQADFSHFSPSPGPSTPGLGAGAISPISFINRNKSTSIGKTIEPPDPYYRPPRARRPTLEMLNSEHDPDMIDIEGHAAMGGALQSGPDSNEAREAPRAGRLNRNSIIAPFSRHFRGDSDPTLVERQNNTDYATRESDFYYGLRGPALSAMPSRRRKTGPADPISPVASATGWFRNFFAGKSKEKGKGFEVVRSTPLHMIAVEEEENEDVPSATEPYVDSPERKRRRTNESMQEAEEEPKIEMDAVSSPDPESEYSATPGAEGRTRSASLASRLDVHIDEENPFDKTILSLGRGRSKASSRTGTVRTVDQPPINFPAAAAGSSISDRPDRVPRRSSKRWSAENPPPIPLASKPRMSEGFRQSSFRRTQDLTAAEAADSRIPFGDADDVDADGERTRSMGAEDAIRGPQAAFMNEGREARSRPSGEISRPVSQVSTGRVVKHTASESIHGPGVDVGRMMGSSAEIHQSP